LKEIYALVSVDAPADVKSAARDLLTTTTQPDITKLSNATTTIPDGGIKFVPFIDATIATNQARRYQVESRLTDQLYNQNYDAFPVPSFIPSGGSEGSRTRRMRRDAARGEARRRSTEKKPDSGGLGKLVVGIVGIVYFALLYKLLLAPTGRPFDQVRLVNLVPFKTITWYLTDSHTPLQQRVYELLGNILVLTPIGIFLALVLRRFSIWPVLAVGIGLSTSVEITQYLWLPGRAADVDDVICNAGGALVAYVVVAYVLHRFDPKRFPSLCRAHVE
jgi:glycopeptide antibiotics resistance protein